MAHDPTRTFQKRVVVPVVMLLVPALGSIVARFALSFFARARDEIAVATVRRLERSAGADEWAEPPNLFSLDRQLGHCWWVT